jgi:hypothetical protein
MNNFRDVFEWNPYFGIDSDDENAPWQAIANFDEYEDYPFDRMFDIKLLKDVGKYKKGSHFYCVDWYAKESRLEFHENGMPDDEWGTWDLADLVMSLPRRRTPIQIIR